MTLDQLPVSSSATISKIGGLRAFRLRLMELGIVPGTPVRKVRVAPLGDPIELLIRGGHLSVRRHEAQAIEVSA